ncbi:MAG: rod shape-determining protein RodA [Candidatus Omnitrophica bacterium]|nr:rod shape-determining protein RodA [Candidatus Omnitrophota bacterium]
MDAKIWRGWDGQLLAAAFGLVAASGLAMASAASSINPELAVRHWGWSVVGLLAGLAVSRSNYLRWIDAAAALYVVSLIALLLVHVIGPTRLGATRWLSVFGFSVQPSELAKLSTALLLARYLSDQPSPLSWRTIGVSWLLAALPAGLIFTQPDLGSASIVIAMWFGLVLVAGASRRTLTALLVGCAALAPVAWQGLKAYQRDRLLVFLDPQIDPLGAGYTIIQSVIAIGSGQLWGRGWFAGTQNQLSFLPERHSDFIFSVIGEEWGLLGCLAVLALFGWLFARLARIGLEATERCGRLLAAGVLSWMGYQAFVNMGMVMGVLPVVGVPLPLVSYGGSSMITLWLALGLVHNVHRRHLH